MRKLPLFASLVIALFGLGHTPNAQASAATGQAVQDGPDSGEHSHELTALSFNIKGLPKPFAERRSELRAIRDTLKAWNQAGQAPDIVLLQEAYTGQALRILREAGYPYVVRGPRVGDQAGPRSFAGRTGPRAPFPPWRWEDSADLMGSGLVIGSKEPIIWSASRPFARQNCAGLDCLKNKGVVMARIQIPGVPTPLDVVNTHLVPRQATGVAYPIANAAHERQLDELAAFIAQQRNPRHPLIFGGDFNIKPEQARQDALRAKLPFALVRERCGAQGCHGDAPWRTFQDHQGFAPGPSITITPLGAAEVFDGTPEGGPELSDHEGYLVRYRVSWKPTAAETPRLARAD